MNPEQEKAELCREIQHLQRRAAIRPTPFKDLIDMLDRELADMRVKLRVKHGSNE